MSRSSPFFFFCLAFFTASLSALEVYDLRCDGLVDPLGIDSDRTHLSWKLRSAVRGNHQTAWQVLAASTESLLDQNVGDIWDTGKRAGDDQVFVRYRGNGPQSGEAVFWKVRVWDAEGEASEWSRAATWTAGLRKPSEWTAQWITHPKWLEFERPSLGYRSPPAETVHQTEWITLDLGAVYPISRIRLHGLRHTVAERMGLPQRYLVELATRPDFSDAVVVHDSRENPVNVWSSRHTINVDAVEARYFRLTAPELRELNDEICLAFSQIEINSGEKNVALGAAATARSSVEEGPWSLASVVDGKGLPGAFPIATETVLVRREFTLEPQLKRAVAFVSGQGQYVLWLNGQKVGDIAIAPGWTNPTKTVLYDIFDVTSLVHPAGKNAIGLSLAGGMYNVPDPEGRYTKFVGRFRPLQGIVQVRCEYDDGSVHWVESDASWKTRRGPTLYSHIYGGEVYDAREEPHGWTQTGFDDASWEMAAVAPGPVGVLRGASHAAPPVKVIESLDPISETRLTETTTMYDLGQNAPLMLRLQVDGPAGSKVRVRPAELLKEDGTIDPHSSRHGTALTSWDYILDGSDGVEIWQSQFFYHGGRYLQVELSPATSGGALPEVKRIEGLVTHSGSDAVGSFACSSELWTRTNELIRWAQRSNLFSLITDCPHRERLGWLEQYHLNGPALRYEFDLEALYRKTFQDMVDAQTERGLIPNIAPEYIAFGEAFRDSPEWGSAIVLSAWQQYLFSGDETAFRLAYDAMQAYVEYLHGKAEGHILDHGLGDWYDIGPNPPGYAQLTPRSLTATAIYFAVCRDLAKIAEKRGRIGEAVAYSERAEYIREAFNEAFFDAVSGTYATNSQTANAMPLALGMVPVGRESDVLEALVATIAENDYAVTAGDVGHRYVLRALAERGRSEVIYQMHHRTDRPGYGWQLEKGKTSLTEGWAGTGSQNHFMLGHINEWFYRGLVGIAPDPAYPAFKHMIIRPQPVGDLTWAEATYESARGPIVVRWERIDDAFTLRVSLPANTTATVHLPSPEGARIQEGGKPLEDVSEVQLIGYADGAFVLNVGSGSYFFSTPSIR